MSARLVWGSGVAGDWSLGCDHADRADTRSVWKHLTSAGLATDVGGLLDDAWVLVADESEDVLDADPAVRGHVLAVREES